MRTPLELTKTSRGPPVTKLKDKSIGTVRRTTNTIVIMGVLRNDRKCRCSDVLGAPRYTRQPAEIRSVAPG